MQRQTVIAGLVAVVVITLCAGVVQATMSHRAADAKAATTAQRQAEITASRTATARRAAASPSVQAQRALTAAMTPFAKKDDGQVAVAVDDLSTGAYAAYAPKQRFVTASIVKVDILSSLLYQAQQAGQPLTEDEQELATTMIENSNNNSASSLYDDAGGAPGIDKANKVLGLTETTVGTGGYWGLTETTVTDQIRLLRQVFTRPSVLTTSSQQYIQGLMSEVEADQQWGVPAVADNGTGFFVKNGWLPNPTLWEINSIGEVTHDHQRMLIAVLSEGNATEDSGISLIQGAVGKAAAAVTTRTRTTRAR